MSLETYLSHLEIVRRLASGAVDDAACALNELPECGWDEFVEFLKEQRLREYFLSAMNDPRLAPAVPAAVRDALVRYGKWSGKRRQQLAELQAEALVAFQACGVGSLVLKGETLANRFYPWGFVRHQGDVDLLVREAEVPTAIGALQSIGAQLRKGKASLSAGRMKQEHAAALTRGQPAVDLHWMLRPGPGYAISMKRVWRDRRPVPSLSGITETVSDDDLLVLLCVSLAADLGRGGVRLKSLLDLFYVRRHLARSYRVKNSGTDGRMRESNGSVAMCWLSSTKRFRRSARRR